MRSPSKTNLVRPSRDGDQFHYLWAARRCLQLLSSKSDLLAITVEGRSPNEQTISEAGDEVIDIGEYFGSQRFESARLVRYMQLKHSTLHSLKPWTTAGMQSTIEGFAQRYRALLDEFSPDALTSKLEFWFVTNRPIGASASEAIADCAAGKPTRHPKELARLQKATGLRTSQLTDFLSLLRLEDRQDSYWDQRHLLFHDVKNYLPDADAEGPLKLKELVTRRALSEGEQNPSITREDVLRALDTDSDRLFPAKCLVEVVKAAVPRLHEPDLIHSIIAATAPILVHASGGVGKTVFATRIADSLPPGSTCILYDCFGNGLYRNASSYRHRHKDALVQIANELSALGLCHLLIPTAKADAPDYVRAFVHRINQASTLVRLANSSALLCIVVDAADNAQMAAEEIGESRSFVRDLIRERLPENVRLVFLCRSHRKSKLDPPAETICLELLPFSRAETERHLLQALPFAAEADIDEFHRLSSQNPRVQALALSRQESLATTLRLLGPNPTTVEDTIGSLLEAAIAKLKDNVGSVERGQIDRICAGLAALRPLIPIPILAKISDVESTAIKSFAIDLGRPLLVAGETIQFFDEPAETWFRERYKPATASMEAFITTLKPLATESAYVASTLPQLMLEAGRFSELVELALSSSALPETSPIEKRDVELQRLQFALKAGLRAGRYLDATKLALKAGGETAGDDRQRSLLQSNTDLGGTFLDTAQIQEIVSRRTFASGWMGSRYAYEAAFMSCRPELLGEARSRLRMADEWLRNLMRLPSEERKDDEVSDQDIVELTLAHVNILGPTSGAKSLGSWRPREVSYRVARIVASRLIDHGRFEDLEAFAKAAGNNLCLILGVTSELRTAQRTLPREILCRAFRLTANKRIHLKDGDGWNEDVKALNAVLALVEAALERKACSTLDGAALLSRYLPAEPPHVLSSRHAGPRFPMLRAYCLRAALRGKKLELRDLADKRLRAEIDKEGRHSTSQQLDEFKRDIGALLPWHQLWASILVGKFAKRSQYQAIEEAYETSKSAELRYYSEGYDTANEIALLWVDILCRLDAQDDSSFETFLNWKEDLRRPLFTPTLAAIARLCAQRQVTVSLSIRFALEAYNLMKEERTDAEQKSEEYVRAARTLLSAAEADAKELFNSALEVAGKVGDENISRWEAVLDLADHAVRPAHPSAETAYHFARCAELTYDYVDRDKHFDWTGTITALCGLCPSSALVILSRWRDRRFGSSERILPIAIERLIEQGSLDPKDALVLTGFRADWQYDEVLDRVLNANATAASKKAAADHLVRYMRFVGGNFAKVAAVLGKHDLQISQIEGLVSQERADRQARSESRDCAGFRQDEASIGEKDWNAIFSAAALTTSEGISRSHALFKTTDVPRHHKEFFKEAIKRVPIGSEAAFLTAMSGVPTFELYHLRDFLGEVPDSWRRPAVTRAIGMLVKEFCRLYCMEIAKYRHYENFPWRRAIELGALKESDIVEVVLGAVAKTPELVGAKRLFSLVGLLVAKLSQAQALEALNFGLELFTPVLEDRDGDGPWSDALRPPVAINASIAGYIWAAMASPDSVIRWEGSHVLLSTIVLERTDLLRHVMDHASKGVGGCFVDQSLPFYKLHGLQWFLIALARAATEHPALLGPYASRILSWALENEPHVLIRQLAARTALALLERGVMTDSSDLKLRLMRINESPFPAIESNVYERATQTSPQEVSDDEIYYFSLDIGPYWYAPLGRVFGLVQHKIENAALKVLRDEFGYAGKGRWDEDARAKRNIYRHEHSHHSHGSYPRTDNLQFYNAYHAMMIVAGNLLASTPTHRQPDYGEEDEFADWLNRHDLARQDGRWLWDRRDSPPLGRPSWWDQQFADKEAREISSDEFEEALWCNGMVTVWGDWVVMDSRREQSVYTSSALVSSTKAVALLRALSTAEDVHDYAIPAAGSDMEILAAGFELKGWIDNRDHGRGLDGLDRWAGGIHFPGARPSRDIIALMQLKADADCRFWTGSDRSIAMTSQIWGHYDEQEHHRRADPERGSRVQGSLDFLTTMLTKLDKELIIKVQISRVGKNQSYRHGDNSDEERIPTKARLYLLSADGRFRTF